MSETSPLGVKVEGAPTDIKGAVVVPGTREVLENMYNEFLDYKQVGTIPLTNTFSGYVSASLHKLKTHWKGDVNEKYTMGQMGRAEFEMWEEMRTKMIAALENVDVRLWGFDDYGVQFIDVSQRHLYKEKVGNSDMVTAQHRDIKIKSTAGNGILRA